MRKGLVLAGLLGSIGGLLLISCAKDGGKPPVTAAATETIITPVTSQALADIPGKEGLAITVEYPPGVSSASHRHNAHVFVYVLEGSVVMQVQGKAAVTLSKGQTFYENPNDIHTVSRNASSTESAKILAFLIKDVGSPPVIPVN
jgi:quercetin dioxygenase-like cupin family protein